MAELWILSAALSTLGCDRGCARAGDPGVASATFVKQDCPTGLARCVAGAVEVTEGRASCAGCPCAWRRELVCPSGCAIENEELVREPNEARSLCKSLQVPATRPAPADAASAACPSDGARFFCHEATVYACPPGASVPLTVCTYGCAREDEALSDPRVDIAAATSILCRAHGGEVVDP